MTHRLCASVTVIPFPGSRRPVKKKKKKKKKKRERNVTVPGNISQTQTDQTLFFNKAACYCPRYAVVVKLICFFRGSPMCSLDCAESALNRLRTLMESALVFY